MKKEGKFQKWNEEKDETSKLNHKGVAGVSFVDNPLNWYNQQESKSNVGVAALKTGVELVSSAVGSSYLGAGFGKYSPIVGTILIFAGHYFGDKSGLLRTLGAGVLAHGVAKAKEYREEPQKQSKNVCQAFRMICCMLFY